MTTSLRPRLSVVTPTLNCAKFIRTCIESIERQSYPDVEHIVVDGGSTDGTIEILRNCPHIRWISEKDDGEAQALNKALRMATGDVIGWMNADDSYIDGAFHKVMKVFESGQDVHCVYGKTLFINDEGTPTHWVIPACPINLTVLTRWFKLNLFQPSIFFRKSLFETLGPYREDLTYGTDYEYWLRCAARGFSFTYLDQALSRSMIYRRGGKTETPYSTKAKEWLSISLSYQLNWSTGEKLQFWRDFYEFRIRMAQSYYGGEQLEMPQDALALCGYFLAKKESVGYDLKEAAQLAFTLPHPVDSNLLGFLAEALHNAGLAQDSAKAFDWGLALESGDPRARSRFGTHSLS